MRLWTEGGLLNVVKFLPNSIQGGYNPVYLLDMVRFIYKDLVSGQDTLEQQILRWKTMYQHRPAMVDELNKALGEME